MHTDDDPHEPPKPRRARAAKPHRGKPAPRVKCSLLLSRENDIRLTVLAAMKDTDRSALLGTILDDALRGVVVSLRGPLSDAEGPETGQGTAE